MSEHVEHGFGPVWDGESRVLILGIDAESEIPSGRRTAEASIRESRQQVEEGRGGR